jgi:serine/threonine protein kinase
MMCLLLKPQRGTLDELYCSQFPIDNEKQNFLYLLHFHLSHQANQDIIPKLLEKMSEVSP